MTPNEGGILFLTIATLCGITLVLNIIIWGIIL